MKHRLSISVDEETVALIQAKLREGRSDEDGNFRNKSHVVETAIKRMLRRQDD